MERDAQIIQAIDQFLAAHDAWANDPNSPQPTADYWRAEELLEDIWDDGGVPLAFRTGIGSAINLLRSERIQLDESGEVIVPDSFYKAVQRLKEARNPNRIEDVFYIEPFHEAAKLPGMSDGQLARMYGLVGKQWPKVVQGDDLIRLDLVQKEKAKPGSVIDENWVHPEQRRLELERQEREKRALSLEFARSQMPRQFQDFAEPAAPESLLDLWALGQNGATGVSVRQASLMTGKSEELVRATWKKYDLQKARGEGIGDNMEDEQPNSRTIEQSDEQPSIETTDGNPGNDLDAMSDKQLKTLAKQLGIGVGARSQRDKLIAKIQAARVMV